MFLTVYGYGSRLSEDLIHAINLAAIKTMAMKRSDIIFTYSRPNDRKFIEEAVRSTEQSGGEIIFVRLTCDKDTLRHRLKLRSSSKHSKISDVKAFAKFERVHGPFREITLRNGMTVDTTKKRPREAALEIAGV